MKTIPSLHALVLFFLAGLVCAQAQAVEETFDRRPDPVRWTLNERARVQDGKLVLAASGPIDRFAGAAMSSRKGDSALNFVAAPIEIELTGITVEGTARPAESVFMAILASDVANEIQARSFLKIRVSGDGMLVLNVPELGGDRTRETTVARVRVTLPIRRLTIRLSEDNFHLRGFDAARPFEQSGTWAGRIELSAWDNSSPHMIVKGVRRPGEGEIMVTLDELVVRLVR